MDGGGAFGSWFNHTELNDFRLGLSPNLIEPIAELKKFN